MPPSKVIWDMDPHTKGKHRVLREYMNAWLPIMTRRNRRILFIDAFAGPGEYSNGEEGSPIIALRALMEHSHKSRMDSQVTYLFIEENADRCNHLTDMLKRLESDIPQNCTYDVINSTFDNTLTEVLDSIEAQNSLLAPSFVMIDPFGVSGTPMDIIARILKNPRSEVYISVMYRDINRFRTHSSFGPHLDGLFGTDEWRQCNDISDGAERREFLYNLYKEQLKKAGAKQVVHFDLYKEDNEQVYAIFFGTQSLDGCDKMKQAIWKEMPLGDYKFVGGRDQQLSFGEGAVDFTTLESALYEEFGYDKWVGIEDIQNFVMSDKTNFHSGHLKIKTLKPMESAGKLEVQPGSRNRKWAYTKGTVLRFVSK